MYTTEVDYNKLKADLGAAIELGKKLIITEINKKCTYNELVVATMVLDKGVEIFSTLGLAIIDTMHSLQKIADNTEILGSTLDSRLEQIDDTINRVR